MTHEESNAVLTPDELLAKLRPEHLQRHEWRIRHYEWLLERLGGPPEAKEQFLAMWVAALNQARYEALDDVSAILKGMRTVSQAKELRVAHEAVFNLKALDMATDQEFGY